MDFEKKFCVNFGYNKPNIMFNSFINKQIDFVIFSQINLDMKFKKAPKRNYNITRGRHNFGMQRLTPKVKILGNFGRIFLRGDPWVKLNNF